MELFRPDKPIDSESEDKFQRYDFARRIATIASSGHFPASLVIGVYGKWGEGKSSVLNCIKTEIDSNAVVINFNPWHFNEQNQLLKSFFSSMASALGKKLTNNKERALQMLGDYAESIGSLVNLAAPGSGGIFKLGKTISEKLRKDSVEVLKKKVDNLIIDANANFVIFIDDIDRLDVQEIQAVFKLVKLVGDFPRTAYILAFDDDMVAGALAPKYSGDTQTAGYTFLEKIIQIPIHLPKASPQALRSYTFDILNNCLDHLKIDLTDQEGRDFVFKFDKAFLPALSNPRLAVRYANSIGFSIPLLLGEANVSDLMVIEGIKIFYPQLYQFIRNNPDHFINNFSSYGNVYSSIGSEEKQTIKSSINKELERCQPSKEDILFMLMDLFPQLKSLFQNYVFSVESYQQWYREKRICSPQYFNRYFSYVVQKGDISDVYFKNLLSGLDTEDIEVLRRRFEIELPKLPPDAIAFKLRNYVPVFNEMQSAVLSVLLACFGEYFPNPSRLLNLSPREEVAFLIRELLGKLAEVQRKQFALLVLQHAKPLDFSVDIFRKLSNPQHRIEDKPFFEPDDIDALTEPIIKRFEEQIKHASIIDILPDYALRIIFNFYYERGRGSEISDLLSEKLKESSSNALSIIKTFTPTITSSTRPDPYKGNFNKDSYENLGRYVDLPALYQATVDSYGQLSFYPPRDPQHDELTDENLVALFQKMYQEPGLTS